MTQSNQSAQTQPRWAGRHIVFEGIDGVGKTTQCKMLQKALEEQGFQVVLTKEPTDGPWGAELRRLAVAGQRLSPEEELEYFIKDRKEHLESLILPSLKEGKIVIQDRYYFSTMAYQGSRGLNPQKIFEDHQAFAPLPDKTFILELQPEESLRRITQSRQDTPNAFEKLDSLQKCAQVFEELDLPGLARVSAMLSPEDIHKQIWEYTLPILPKKTDT